MLRKVVLLIWLSVWVVSSYAQSPHHSIPDYAEIEKLTKDRSSAFHYDGLFARYRANDTTLTLRDYRMLYYGHFFQPDFSPFNQSAEADSIKWLLGAKDELDESDWQMVVRLGTANVEKNPFDLKGLNMVWIAHRTMGDNTTAAIYFDKLKKLVQTILATGDGLSEQTAFHVVNVSHEYDILNILGYEFGGEQTLTDGKCDYLSLKSNEENIEGLYFDVKQIFKGYELSLNRNAP